MREWSHTWLWWGFPHSLSNLLQIYRLKSGKSNLFRIEFRQHLRRNDWNCDVVSTTKKATIANQRRSSNTLPTTWLAFHEDATVFSHPCVWGVASCSCLMGVRQVIFFSNCNCLESLKMYNLLKCNSTWHWWYTKLKIHILHHVFFLATN